jgi:hypothetical protein
MIYLKTFEGLDSKTPREIVNLFNDVFMKLEDMGGELGYASSNYPDYYSGFVSMDSTGPIYVNKYGEIHINFGCFHAVNKHEIYLYLKNNLDSLIERFKKLYNCKVNLSISICLGESDDYEWFQFKVDKNKWYHNTKIDFDSVESLRTRKRSKLSDILKEDEIININIHFEIETKIHPGLHE